jgi:hypothetical protein
MQNAKEAAEVAAKDLDAVAAECRAVWFRSSRVSSAEASRLYEREQEARRRYIAAIDAIRTA